MLDGFSKLKELVKVRELKKIVGQEKVVRFLEKCLRNEFYPQALMINGPFGTGKTALARVYARAINCSAKNSIRPCYECKFCASNLDVFELNSSHYSKIDDIKEVISDLRARPFLKRFKVYLLDEIHTLTPKSFNTLLKEIEDAPDYIKFIGITTEVDSIPPVFLSRFVPLDLGPISDEIMRNYLEDLLERIRAELGDTIIDPSVSIDEVVSIAHGSARKGIHALLGLRGSGDDITHWSILYEIKKGFDEGLQEINRRLARKNPTKVLEDIISEVADEIALTWSSDKPNKEKKISLLNEVFGQLNLCGLHVVKKDNLICLISQIRCLIQKYQK